MTKQENQRHGDAIEDTIPSSNSINLHGHSTSRPVWTFIGYGFVFVLIFLVGQFIIDRMGFAIFALFLVGIFSGFFYAFISWRSLFVPFLITILSVGGFKYFWSIDAPGLPDIYLDRVATLWLAVFFVLKFVIERRKLRPPFLLDTILLLNALFLFFYIFYYDFHSFNLWTKSYVIPYVVYYTAKNIITSQKRMRALMILLAILNVYYSLTSIGEKFDISFLVWPHSILYAETPWPMRSNGPFAHAPLFGTVIGMILPVYLYIIATTKNRLAQLASYIGFVLGVAGLYFTYTRGSWLAGIIAIAVAVVLNKRQYLRIILPALVVLPMLAIFVLGIGNDKVMKERVENENTMATRMGVAVTALNMWRDNPLIGVGFFRFPIERLNYIVPVHVPVFGTVNVANFRHTSIHDIYIGPLAETGLVGTFLQLAIYLIIFKTFVRHYRDPNAPPYFRYYILPVFGGFFCGYLMGGIAIDYRFFPTIGAIFYSAAGIIYGYEAEDETNHSDTGNLALVGAPHRQGKADET